MTLLAAAAPSCTTPPCAVLIVVTGAVPAGYLAEASPDRRNDRCIIRVKPQARDNRFIIAHELCHCLYDWDAMTPFGWAVPSGEVEQREARANACARIISEPTEYGRARR